MANDTQTVYAVVQTGCTTREADVVPFKTDEGLRTPAILFTHPDRGRCDRMKRRLLTRFSRMRGFIGAKANSLELATPILGVVEIEVNLPPKKKPKAPAHPGTNGELSPVPTPEPTAPEPTEQESKRRHRREQAPVAA